MDEESFDLTEDDLSRVVRLEPRSCLMGDTRARHVNRKLAEFNNACS